MKMLQYITRGLLIVALVISFNPAATTAQEPVAETGINPKYIVMPTLGLFASVEAVGQTATGAMDVPSYWEDVAWYQPGYAPGEDGHAVFAGHLDWEGNQGPFWGLADVPSGSLIALLGEEGRILIYSTVSNLSYDADTNATAQVFGPSNESRLSLITCEGDFVEAEDTYDRRRVIEAKLIFDSADGELKLQ